MAKKSLKFISSKMRKLDLCMMNTRGSRGVFNCRPMSNNGDVEYDGNSYFFTFENSNKVKEIKKDANVSLNFTAKKDLFITVTGKARLIRSKPVMAEHWVPSLAQWFKKGVDTAGIVMVVVKANTIKYWQNMDQGVINVK